MTAKKLPCFRLRVSDGRESRLGFLVTEPFLRGDEDRVHAALDTLKLSGFLIYDDGSTLRLYPGMPARADERVYPPASAAATLTERPAP